MTKTSLLSPIMIQSLLSAVLLSLILCGRTGSTLVCDLMPVYNAGSISRTISYNNANNNRNLAYDFALDFTITTSLSSGKYNLSASMDTGSTGVAIRAKLMNLTLEDVQIYPKGHESLSGGTFWEGYWIPASEVNLTFAAGAVTAKVPILAVTERSTCHKFKDGECKNKTDAEQMPTYCQISRSVICGIRTLLTGLFFIGFETQPRCLRPGSALVMQSSSLQILCCTFSRSYLSPHY